MLPTKIQPSQQEVCEVADSAEVFVLVGEISTPDQLKAIVVTTEKGSVLLGDIATISFKDQEATSYARDFGTATVMLDIKKRGGKNLIEAAKQIRELVVEAKSNDFPEDVSVTISNDMSSLTLNQVNDLVNNIIVWGTPSCYRTDFFLGF